MYIELVRKYGRDNVFFGQEENGYEIDFVVRTKTKFLCFQVCLRLTDENAKREFRNLELAHKYLKSDGVVLYLDNNLHSSLQNMPAQPIIEWILNN